MPRGKGTESSPAAIADPEPVKAHYDLSNEFFALFLDPTMTYSCAYFEVGDETLEEAQRKKIDLALGKLDLQPGHRLLDVGFGWGGAAFRAREKWGVRVVGLNLSENQFSYARARAAGADGLEFRLEGWESFHEPVDRIVSIGAFEHFGKAKYLPFFARCRELLPEDGRLLLQTITAGRPSRSFAVARWSHFILKRIFPGGRLPGPEEVVSSSRDAGLEMIHAESLRTHYATTLDRWSEALARNRQAACAATSRQIFEDYMKYLTSCAKYFRSGEINVYQFLMRVIPGHRP